MKRKTYNRTCPECKEVVKHLDKGTYLEGIKHNKICRSCSARRNMKKLNQNQSGKGNPMYGRSVKDVWIEKYGQETADKMWSERSSKASKSMMGKNVGMKNGMKQLEARLKASKTRTEKMKDPEFRKIFSEGSRRAWREGKMDGVNVGQSKWWDYETKSGRIVKCQGTWELKYVEYLDKNNIPFKAHRGTIPYVMNGKKHSYYPDFHLIAEDRYIDVKNDYHYSISRDKFKAIRKCNPNIKLDILLKEDLNRLGIEV